MIYYIPIDIDKKQLENCIKNTTLMHNIKDNVESKEYNSLKELKNVVIKCYSLLKEHLCICKTCKKEFKINKLDKHFCNNNDELEFINPNSNINLIKKSSKKSSKKTSKKTSKKSSKKAGKKTSKKTSKK
jgi:hypothetical protein